MIQIPLSKDRVQQLIDCVFKRINDAIDYTEKETELSHSWHQLYGIKQVIEEAERDLMVHAALNQEFSQYHEYLEIQSGLYQALIRIEELFEAHLRQKPS